MMLAGDRLSNATDMFSTPRKVQKRLFTAGSSSSKRNLFTDVRNASSTGEQSGYESDLGPMSPLAFSDATPSSVGSSPGREHMSPLATPEAAQSRSHYSNSSQWRRLQETKSDRTSREECSPFSALRKLTRSARCSQRRRILLASPQLRPSTMDEDMVPESPTTPKRSNADISLVETPKRGFGREIQNTESNFEIIAETPQKKDSPVKRLITPLGSVSKEAALPRIHHRKSMNSLSMDGDLSPADGKENSLKRSAHDVLAIAPLKLFKSDENNSIPRARAALFQERKEEFKLSTKTFYSSPPVVPTRREQSASVEWRDVDRSNKRHSLPTYAFSRKRCSKKRKYGEINAGITHGIKRPKPKKHVSRAEAFKKEKFGLSQSLPLPQNSANDSPRNATRDCSQDGATKKVPAPVEKFSPIKIDPNKKFFITNRTVKRNLPAVVTVNDMLKLQVSNGTIKINAKPPIKHTKKKPKIADISFDTGDLAVDDPVVQNLATQTKVASILQTLEDDWADDNYDEMECLANKQFNASSPLKSLCIPNDVMMSPASELSNMTSVMNIDDAVLLTASDNILSQINESTKNEDKSAKYYPLFEKGMVHDKNSVTTNGKTRGVKRSISWQLSTKNGNGADQYQLDAGQKKFGAIQCPECGVIYHIGDPEDEYHHLNYHNSVKILKFTGWKQERVITTDLYTSGRIILVEPSDPKQYWKKVSEVLAVVDRDLGLSEIKVSEYRDNKIYLYIKDKEIIGVLAAEHVTKGYRMIPDIPEIDCCTSDSSPVKCGVNVIWTTMNYRRRGIATKLMDVLRANFYFGYILSTDDIAFSMPTPSGKAFAIKYTKATDFKVYT